MVAKQAKPLQGEFLACPDAIVGRAVGSGLELGIITLEVEDERIGNLHERARLLTLASEVTDSSDLIDYAIDIGVIHATGHCDGTHEDGLAAIDSGVWLPARTFNAMRPHSHSWAGSAR